MSTVQYDFSDLHRLESDVTTIIESFGFDATVEGRELGQTLADGVVEGIVHRGAEEHKGAEGTWDANEPKYEEKKFSLYGVRDPNVRTGQMLSKENVGAIVTITKHLVEIEPGLDEPPSSSATGFKVQDKDKEVTGAQKTKWAHEPNKRGITRPFMELDDAIAGKCFEDVSEGLGHYLGGS
jgi:hypothetical protein